MGMHGSPMEGGSQQMSNNPSNPDWPITPREERPFVSGPKV
jgi:hypothetical protein